MIFMHAYTRKGMKNKAMKRKAMTWSGIWNPDWKWSELLWHRTWSGEERESNRQHASCMQSSPKSRIQSHLLCSAVFHRDRLDGQSYDAAPKADFACGQEAVRRVVELVGLRGLLNCVSRS